MQDLTTEEWIQAKHSENECWSISLMWGRRGGGPFELKRVRFSDLTPERIRMEALRAVSKHGEYESELVCALKDLGWLKPETIDP